MLTATNHGVTDIWYTVGGSRSI